jgi:hypothetical protein
MDQFFTLIIASALFGFLCGGVVVALGFSAFRSFIVCYACLLLFVMTTFSLQGSFILGLLGTMSIAIFSFVPAAGCFTAGAFLIRGLKVKKYGE